MRRKTRQTDRIRAIMRQRRIALFVIHADQAPGWIIVSLTHPHPRANKFSSFKDGDRIFFSCAIKDVPEHTRARAIIRILMAIASYKE
jgi:hypothetical protein